MNSANTVSDFSDLVNKNIVITGGAGVLGFAMADALSQVGANLALIGRTETKVQSAAETLRQNYQHPALGIVADVTDKVSLLAAHQQIQHELGSIDVLINCAGGNHPSATTNLEQVTPEHTDAAQSFFGIDMERFRQVIDLNLIGTVLPTQIFCQDMMEKKQGVIINISSMAAQRPLTKVAAYSASKSAIDNFTQWLAVHLAELNIRVNAIAPGFFLTEQNKFLLIDPETGSYTQRGEKIIHQTPMKQLGKPEALQGAVLYLASNLSSFVTGIILPVDGGFGAYSGV